MTPTSWEVVIILREEGSALTGRDVLCADGKYHRCRTVWRDGAERREKIVEELDGEEVYDIMFFGPYSNSD